MSEGGGGWGWRYSILKKEGVMTNWEDAIKSC